MMVISKFSRRNYGVITPEKIEQRNNIIFPILDIETEDFIVNKELNFITAFALENPDLNSNSLNSAISSTSYRVCNIKTLEVSLGKVAEKESLALQFGDVLDACVDDLVKEFDYKSSMRVKQGMDNFTV